MLRIMEYTQSIRIKKVLIDCVLSFIGFAAPTIGLTFIIQPFMAKSRLFGAAVLRGNWALRSALFCRTRCIRPCGRARRHTNFAVGRRRCGSRMLPSCGATIHAGSAGRLRRAAGLLRRNMILLRDLGGAIRRNARRLLHRLGIASADGRALRSCCTGDWRILRAT